MALPPIQQYAVLSYVLDGNPVSDVFALTGTGDALAMRDKAVALYTTYGVQQFDVSTRYIIGDLPVDPTTGKPVVITGTQAEDPSRRFRKHD